MGIWKKDTCNIDIIVTISKRILGPGWWYGWVVVPDIIYERFDEQIFDRSELTPPTCIYKCDSFGLNPKATPRKKRNIEAEKMHQKE